MTLKSEYQSLAKFKVADLLQMTQQCAKDKLKRITVNFIHAWTKLQDATDTDMQER